MKKSFAVLCIGLTIFLCSCSDSHTSFTLHFPDTVELGELWMYEDVNCMTCGNGEKYLGKAKGTYHIRLPAEHWYVSLEMPKDVRTLMPYLREESLANIGDIDLSNSNVIDEDLQYLSNTNLRSINLNNTSITGSGLQYIKQNPNWIFVYIRNCKNLDRKYLTHFQGWKRSTIAVASEYRWGEEKTKEQLDILKQANHLICNDQPENICHTQIR